MQLSAITLLGGGYPLFEGGLLVGAFAIGGALIDQDMACASVVLEQINS